MGVAAGRAGAGGDTAKERAAGAPRELPPSAAASLAVTTRGLTTAIAPPSLSRSRDYLFLIEWQLTNQPTYPATGRATSEASEPSNQF